MPNFVIIHDKKMGFVQESSFWEEMPLCTGSLHYQFNTKYETLPNIEPKLAALTLVITNGKKYFIGLKYEPSLDAPLIIMKGSCVTAIKKYCAENKIQIVNDRSLAAKLCEYDTGEYIPCECWDKVAGFIAKGYSS
jgi:type III secretion system FlhB-like substrate exporter